MSSLTKDTMSVFAVIVAKLSSRKPLKTSICVPDIRELMRMASRSTYMDERRASDFRLEARKAGAIFL